MDLSKELALHKPIAVMAHEAVLSIYYTAAKMKKKADEFFEPYGLTDVQFNVMMLIKHQSGEEKGLSQADLSDMMLVNRANITSLIDRMEKRKLVVRATPASDRRFNIVSLTTKGTKLLEKVEPPYIKEVKRIVSSLSHNDLDKLIEALQRIRRAVK